MCSWHFISFFNPLTHLTKIFLEIIYFSVDYEYFKCCSIFRFLLFSYASCVRRLDSERVRTPFCPLKTKSNIFRFFSNGISSVKWVKFGYFSASLNVERNYQQSTTKRGMKKFQSLSIFTKSFDAGRVESSHFEKTVAEHYNDELTYCSHLNQPSWKNNEISSWWSSLVEIPKFRSSSLLFSLCYGGPTITNIWQATIK